MAVNIGPKIGLDGEKEYRSALGNIIQEQKTLNSEMKKLSSTFDDGTSTIKKNREAHKLLEQQIQNQQKRVDMLRAGLQEYERTTGEGSTQTLKMKQALYDAEAELSRLQQDFEDTSPMSTWGTALDEVGQKLQDIGGKITDAGKTLSTYVTGPIVGVGAASVKMASEFEDSMAKVSTIADTSTVPLETLETQIKELSDQTGMSASEIAESVYNAISAGQDTGDAVAFVAQATELARAGFTDTASATDILTTALNAYGMEADEVGHVSDVLITTQNLGKTTVAELAGQMGRVIPTAKANGVQIETLAGAYAVMTANGINTAQTTTYLGSMLNELGKSGSKADIAFHAATEHIQEGGISMQEAMERGWDLTDVLSLLDEQAYDSGKSISDMFGSAEAGKAATVLLDNAESLNSAVEQMEGSAGATTEAYAKLDTTSMRTQIALNMLKNSGTELGTTLLEMLAPSIEKIANGIEAFSNWVSQLDDGQKRTIITVIGLVAAIGPALVVIGKVISIVGTVVSAISGIPTLITGISTAATTCGAFISSAASTITTAIGAIPVIGWIAIGVALFATLYAKCEWFRDGVNAIVEKVVGWVTDAWQTVKETFENLKSKVTEVWDNVKQKITDTVENIKSTIKEKFESAKQTVSDIFESIRSKIKEKIDAAKEAVDSAIQKIKGLFNFEWKLPNLKMPHIKATGEWSLMPPKAPSFSLEWYSKAMQNGMILRNATIFGASGNTLLAGGESGAEAVVGVDSLNRMVSNAVAASVSALITGSPLSPSISNTYGDTVLNFYPQPGMDVEELAELAAEKVNDAIRSQQEVFA